MKKLLLFAFLLIAGMTYGQDTKALWELGKITFYGVDFNKAKVFGATETPAEFVGVYGAINQLFIGEAKKYDPTKAFGVYANVSVDAVAQRNNAADKDHMMTGESAFLLSKGDVESEVRALKSAVKEKEGYGAVLVANLLNKAASKATYDVVIFDIATGQVLCDQKVTRSAQGFGLRNYWAGSVHDAMGAIKKLNLRVFDNSKVKNL
jgi:hypothetical protein